LRSNHSRAVSRRRALGQHYLVDESVVDLMVRTAGIEGHERVLEIGTGKGVVTRELCKVATSVEAFELDLANYLATKRLNLEGLTLRAENAFSGPREFDILVSSLPYSESSNFVEWLAKLRYKKVVVILQRDFAEKLLARPGDERYRATSVISQISSNVRIIRGVEKASFEPPPSVSSVLVTIRQRRILSEEEIHLIKMLFSQRRRKLGSALRNLKLSLADAKSSELSRRVEHLSAEEMERLLSRVEILQTLSTSRVPNS
jgi:16S rRNA (adenine1518-N6/adenine1519-N6)-dimethyltransferase